MIAAPEHVKCPSCGTAGSLDAPTGMKVCPHCGGSLLIGSFALVDQTGRDGVAVAYRAWQPDRARTVALTLYPAKPAGFAGTILQAAKAAAGLSHPQLARIYECGSDLDRVFVASQYFEGDPILKATLTLREAVTAVRDAALALEYAHGRGMVHPDLRPQNIRIGPRDQGRRVFILNIGLPSPPDAEGWHGPWPFMSPEESEGLAPDPRSNVFTLGAVLYTLAVGRAPFRTEDPIELMRMIGRGNFDRPSLQNPAVDSRLERVILQAMERLPERRYSTAALFAADLSAWLGAGGEPVRGPEPQAEEAPAPIASPENPPRPSRPRTVATRSRIGVAAVLLVACFAWLLWSWETPPAAVKPGVPPNPSAQVPPEPEPPPTVPPPVVRAVASDRCLGTVQSIHPRFGAFVRLLPGAKVAAGEALEIMNGDEVVGEIVVTSVEPPDKKYEHGCAVCRLVRGSPKGGEEVRRARR